MQLEKLTFFLNTFCMLIQVGVITSVASLMCA